MISFKNSFIQRLKIVLFEYIWIDLFAGEGNLILPILEVIPKSKRINFFKNHIFLFDIQKEMVENSILNACAYGIPEDLAKENIQVRDTLKDYLVYILRLKYPPFHITNPPLYLFF